MIKIEKKYVLKTLSSRSMCVHNDQSIDEWLNHYLQFQNQEQCLVKITNFDKSTSQMTMERVQGINLADTQSVANLSREVRRDIGCQIITLYGRMHKWTVNTNDIFFHKDFNTSNIIYNPKTKLIKLIDPDSFQVLYPYNINSVYHGGFIDTLYAIKQWETL